MKEITIYCNSSQPIVLYDDDDINIEDYTAGLIKLFESNNVIHLHVSEGSLVARPNEITAVVVKDNKDNDEPKEKPTNLKISEIKEEDISSDDGGKITD